jgi:putative acetyltransferase
MKLRKAKKTDVLKLLKLYKSAAKTENGIARTPNEIDKNFIAHFLKNALKKGLIFVIENEGELIAEIHCYRFDPVCFRHTMANLTLVVHPDFQGMGFGKKIFTHLLDEIENKHPDILRVELFVRKSNLRGKKLYQSLGFKVEGSCKNRILNAEGNLEDDTMMAWFNPGFKGWLE